MRAATPCASPGSCACGRISRRKRQTRLNARGKSIPNRHLPNSGQMEHPMELRYLEKDHVLRQNTSGGGALGACGNLEVTSYIRTRWLYTHPLAGIERGFSEANPKPWHRAGDALNRAVERMAGSTAAWHSCSGRRRPSLVRRNPGCSLRLTSAAS